MIRRPPRSTLSSSSAASDVYRNQVPQRSAQLPRGDPPDVVVQLPWRSHLEIPGRQAPAISETRRRPAVDPNSTAGNFCSFDEPGTLDSPPHAVRILVQVPGVVVGRRPDIEGAE